MSIILSTQNNTPVTFSSQASNVRSLVPDDLRGYGKPPTFRLAAIARCCRGLEVFYRLLIRIHLSCDV
jgi:hypothetical protein